MVWWRQALHHSKDGVPNTLVALSYTNTPSNYVDMQTTSQQTLAETWSGMRC
eukprot:CAMPEP_0176289720 /NCGR_PEP_ID=MMETSP0121_2-20121125/54646_1 /TAXON_ID=160619 /ORGANISM="Kryptoperidinium foliaceum, Strain CCMP 1326" /LENGTH=51 /DNA_ID=CAMNT_0017630475 /DNA_START=9 /DNA_END=161 /DNA_ORIENTATION=-